MKIALCKPYFAGPVSGADETLVAYAIALHKSGYNVQVVLLYRCTDDDQYYIRLKNAGVPVSFVVSRSLMFKVLRQIRHLLATTFFFVFLIPGAKEFLHRVWQALMKPMTRPRYRACRKFLAAARPDVLHVFTPENGAAVMIRAGHGLGIPVLYHELGTSQHMPMLSDHYRGMKRVLPLCTQVAALSPRLAAEWSERFPFLRSITVLPLVIEQSEIFNLSSEPPDDLKDIVFGFAARLEDGKGPLNLIDALEEVNRQEPLTVARIAGVGPQLHAARARARELALDDACEFVGHYSEPLGRTAFMKSLDVFVLPSLAEGTPNCVIEAMAHGVPIIASEIGGIPDIVGDDAGILVPPGDTSKLAEAMLRLAKDSQLRKKMGMAAQERYQKLFSASVVVPLLLEVYERTMGKGHAAEPSVAGNGHLHPWSQFEVTDVQAYGLAVAVGSLAEQPATI